MFKHFFFLMSVVVEFVFALYEAFASFGKLSHLAGNNLLSVVAAAFV